jgi:hypothetical protein
MFFHVFKKSFHSSTSSSLWASWVRENNERRMARGPHLGKPKVAHVYFHERR